MKGNFVAKHMNKVNRPSIHKNGNKASQEPLEDDTKYCKYCGSLDVDQNSLDYTCNNCKEYLKDDTTR